MMTFQHNKDRIYEFDISIFELTRAQKFSYLLFINLLFKDFDYIIYEVLYNSKVKESSNERFDSVEISKST